MEQFNDQSLAAIESLTASLLNLVRTSPESLSPLTVSDLRFHLSCLTRNVITLSKETSKNLGSSSDWNHRIRKILWDQILIGEVQLFSCKGGHSFVKDDNVLSIGSFLPKEV